MQGSDQYQRLRHQLGDHLPADALDQVCTWLVERAVSVIITPSRRSKLGDHTWCVLTNSHRITINRETNHYRFLITLIHELAHVETRRIHGIKPKPHGNEWKHYFRLLLSKFIDQELFPVDVEIALERHLRNPKYTDTVDAPLQRILSQYDGV